MHLFDGLPLRFARIDLERLSREKALGILHPSIPASSVQVQPWGRTGGSTWPSPGGYVTSFTHRGFKIPSGPTSFGSNGIDFPILKDRGLEAAVRAAPSGRQISWDDHDLPINDPHSLCAHIEVFIPYERKGLCDYFSWAGVGRRRAARCIKKRCLRPRLGRHSFLGCRTGRQTAILESLKPWESWHENAILSDRQAGFIMCRLKVSFSGWSS